MTSLERLESLGYRFTLAEDGGVRWQLYGPEPPEGPALLAALDREQVRQALQDRARGFTVVPPQEIRTSGAARYLYMAALKQALEDGALLDVQAVYHRRTGDVTYRLTPPGVDLSRYLPAEAFDHAAV